MGTIKSGSKYIFVPRPSHSRAGPIGVVEGEHAGADLRQTDPAVHAGELLAENQFFPPGDFHFGDALGQIQGRGQRIGQTFGDVFLDDQAVHQHLQGVLLVFIQEDLFASSRTVPSTFTRT